MFWVTKWKSEKIMYSWSQLRTAIRGLRTSWFHEQGDTLLLWWHNPNKTVPETRIRQFFLERIADLPQVMPIIGLFAFWGRSTFLEAVLLVITRSTLMAVFRQSSNLDTSLTFIFHPLQDIYSKVLVRLTNLILENQGEKSNYLLTTWFALFTSIGTYVLWLMQF